jgi:hypothetical protein
MPALVIAGALLFALSPFVSPVEAAPVGQWWVGGDLWFAEPTNLSTDVAFDFQGGILSGGEVIGPDLGTELSGRIRGGWKDRDTTRNSYSISYWSWDNDTSMSEGGGLQVVVSDPLFSNDLTDSVESKLDLKATVLDLMLSRRLAATKRSAWYWGVGLRRASFEQSWEIDYFESAIITPGPEESIDIDVESKGLGLSAGIGTTYSWHPRWRSHARAQVAFLRGTTDASYRDRGIDNFLPGQPFTTGIEREDDRVFQQLELDARVSFTVLTGFDVYLGYWLFNWGEVVQVDRFLDDVQGGASFTRDELSFDGFIVGGTYTFP